MIWYASWIASRIINTQCLFSLNSPWRDNLLAQTNNNLRHGKQNGWWWNTHVRKIQISQAYWNPCISSRLKSRRDFNRPEIQISLDRRNISQSLEEYVRESNVGVGEISKIINCTFGMWIEPCELVCSSLERCIIVCSSENPGFRQLNQRRWHKLLI